MKATSVILASLLILASHAPAAAQGRRGNGPPFCRSGAGHPTHGWAWCVQKGWAPRPAPAPVSLWRRVVWHDVVFRREACCAAGYRDAGLVALLGGRVLERLLVAGHAPARGALEGRWVAAGRALSLEVRVGGRPLARLTDVNRDGRVDRVLVRALR